MGAKARGKANESGAVEEWGRENGEKIRRIVVRYWGRSWKRTAGFGDEGDSGWGCGQGPSGYSEDIGRRGIGSDNALSGGRNNMLGGSAGEWTEEGLESYLWSTKTLLVEGHVLRQIPKGRTRPRCWKKKCGWIRR